jgi:hypothetical protein
LAPVVTHGLALPIFHDRRIAAGIRPRQVHCCPRLATRA